MKTELIKIYNKHLTALDSGDFGSGVQFWMSEQDFLDALHDYEVLKQLSATGWINEIINLNKYTNDNN